MKNRFYFQIGLMLVAILILFGCSENHEKKIEAAKEKADQANKELTAAQTDYADEWQQFKTEAHAQMLANQKKIEQFKDEMKTESGKFKVKYESQVGILEQKNIELNKRITEYKYQSKSNWEEFKRGFNHDSDELVKTLKGILAEKK